MAKNKIWICTKCKKEFLPIDKALLPFCSKRCKMIDLGLWLSENYVVENQEQANKKEIENDDE